MRLDGDTRAEPDVGSDAEPGIDLSGELLFLALVFGAHPITTVAEFTISQSWKAEPLSISWSIPESLTGHSFWHIGF